MADKWNKTTTTSATKQTQRPRREKKTASVILAWTSIFGNRFIYIRVVCACTYNFIGLSLDNCRSSFVQQFYRFSSSVSILFPLAMRGPLFFFSLSLFCSLSIYVLRFSSFVSDNCLWPVQFLVSHVCGAPIVFDRVQSEMKNHLYFCLHWCRNP